MDDTPNGSDADGTMAGEVWVESSKLPDAPAIPAPQVQAPVTDAPKRKGRKPYPRDENGNIIRPDGSIAPVRGAKRAAPVKDAGITDEVVGKAIGGAFMVTSIPLGSHWRLLPHEMQALGEAFGPVFRMYPNQVGEYLKLLMVAPTVVSVVGPRLMVQKLVFEGSVDKDHSRKTLLNMLAFMKAEEQLTEEEMTKSGKELMEQVIKVKPELMK